MRPAVPASQDYIATQKESQCSQDNDAAPLIGAKGWGRLWALARNLAHLDLVNDEVMLGRRPTCNYVFDGKVMASSNLTLISGNHCRIFRVPKAEGKDDALPTFIEDLSSNGTFVNSVRMQKGEHKLLCHGDRIDFVRPTRTTTHGPVAYMFEDFSTTQRDLKLHEISEKYSIGKELGACAGTSSHCTHVCSGNFSRVFLAFRKSDRMEVAIKCIDKRRFWGLPKTKEQLLREAAILRDVQHPSIIAVHEVVDSSKFLYLVLELASGGELFDMIRQRGCVTENETRVIFRQMFSAVAYLHERGIAHRDLKPENVLFSSSEPAAAVKITDFGLARMVGDGTPSGTLCGTPQYVAPEIISVSAATNTTRAYGVEVDMWSLGVMLYVLLSGIFPFDESARVGSLFQQIENGAYDFPNEYFANVSEEAKALIRALLVLKPQDRLTAVDALKHPWVVQPPSADPTVLSLSRLPSLPKEEFVTPDKIRPVTVDTDSESSGTKRQRKEESLAAEQFSPEIVKSFKLKLPPSAKGEGRKLTFSK